MLCIAMTGENSDGKTSRRAVLKATGVASGVGLAGLSGFVERDTNANVQDNYPSDSIRYIIPFSEGGGTDVYGRQMMPIVGEQLGVNIQIENIPGAASLRGTGQLAYSDPDGYTIGGFNPPSTPVSAMVNPPDFDLQNLTGVGAYARTPFVIVANPNYEIENMQDLLSRYQNGDLQVFAGKEKGGVDHVLALLMKGNEEYNFNWNRYVGYDGSGPAVQACISDEVPAAISTDTAAQGAVEDGRVDTVACLSSEGTEVFPDLQPVTEEGFPNIDFLGQLRRCIFAPPETSDDQVQVLTEALEATLQTDEMQQWSEQTGNVIEYGPPEAAEEAVAQAFEQVPENVDLEAVREESG